MTGPYQEKKQTAAGSEATRSRKIIRDIRRQKPNVLTIQEVPCAKPVLQDPGLLDLSSLGQHAVIFNSGKQQRISDVVRKPSPQEPLSNNGEKVFFFHIDAEKRFTLDKTGELARMLAMAMLILIGINLVNVVQRGYMVRDQVVSAAFSGYSQMLEGGEKARSTDFQQANDAFTKASDSFEGALQDLSFLSANQNLFLGKEKTVQSAEALLGAGDSLSKAGVAFAEGIGELKTLPEIWMQENGKLLQEGGKLEQPPKFSLTEKLQTDLEFFEDAAKQLEIAKDNIELVDKNVLPEDLKPKFQLLQEKLQTLLALLQELQQKIPAFLDLLGDRYPHRYLVLIQNDTEARPTGGFIGSFLLLELNDGYITKNEFHDVYAQDGLLKEQIPLPEDIAQFTNEWRLRDSNYSPDFPLSAEKAAWFLQKEKGPSVDTVIALNQSALADLFELTGPIQLPDLKAPLTKENYQQIISYIVESKLAGSADPKKILRDFIPAFQKKLFAAPFEKMLPKLLTVAQRGKIMFYSRNLEVQQLFDDWGISGRVYRSKPGEDYLQIISTSIGGNKSDLYMQQKVLHETFVESTGTVADSVTFTKKHTFGEQEKAVLQSRLAAFGFGELAKGVEFILGNGKNTSLVKFYVPLGSELLEVKDIDAKQVLTRVDTELQRTYFMFEMEVDPGKESTVQISYRLPQKIALAPAGTYRFFVEPQTGTITTDFEKKIYVNPTLEIFDQYPQNFGKDEKGNLRFQKKLEGLEHLAVLVGE